MPEPNSNLRWLADEFVTRLVAVLETMTGERPVSEWEPSAAPASAPENAVFLRQPFEGIHGSAWILAANADWMAVGNHVLRAAGLEESDADSVKSTYLETIGQAISGLAQAFSARLGREITPKAGVDAGAEWVASESTQDSVKINLAMGAQPGSFFLVIERALLESLDPSTSPTEQSASGDLVHASSAAVAAVEHSKTFELLLDVELPVSLSFGRAQVALKEALRLTTGSIIELNRTISEPVEVIVNNCVIARGEVVVVEGNFGVRIQEVISRQERLRTLN